jgi:predicted ArsR family transcriptional regulator
MARPRGQFDANKERTFSLIAELAGTRAWCKARSSYLASRLGVQERQVKRYLTALKREGRLEVETSGLLVNGETQHRYKLRRMRPAQQGPGLVGLAPRLPRFVLPSAHSDWSAPKGDAVAASAEWLRARLTQEDAERAALLESLLSAPPTVPHPKQTLELELDPALLALTGSEGEVHECKSP